MVKRAFSANRRGRGAREGSGGMEEVGGQLRTERLTLSRVYCEGHRPMHKGSWGGGR